MTNVDPDNPYGIANDEDDLDSVSIGGMDNIESKFRCTAGYHAVLIVGAKKDVSKSSGNQMVVLTMQSTGTYGSANAKVLDKSNPADAGKEVKDYYVLTEAAKFRLEHLRQAFDLPLGPNGQLSFKPSQLIGKRAVANFVDEPYEDTIQSKCKRLFRHPDGPTD